MVKTLSEKAEELLTMAKERIKFKGKIISLMKKFANDEENIDKYVDKIIKLFETSSVENDQENDQESEVVEGEIVNSDDLPF